MIALLTGLLAGTLHVWSGPDHLAAIAPLAARHTGRCWVPGVRWGLGHSAGVALVGTGALLAKGWLPVDAISGWGEFIVGVLLIFIGLWALLKTRRIEVHSHSHQHSSGEQAHEHLHFHTDKTGASEGHAHLHAALGIGVLHGLAGSSHFFGVLPMLGMRTTLESALYLAAFAAGTILSMAVFSTGIGLLSKQFKLSSQTAYRVLLTLCGLLAIGVGVVWICLAQTPEKS